MTIIIDFKGLEDRIGLFEQIDRQIKDQNWYMIGWGKNWNALWDIIVSDVHFNIINVDKMNSIMLEDLRILIDIIIRMKKEGLSTSLKIE